MSWYRKVDVRVWGDSKFRSLSAPTPNAQTIWLYLLTGPHTTSVPGLFHVGEGAIFEALGWDDESLSEDLREGYRKAFREAFLELSEKGMLKSDRKARVIWLPNYIKYNLPESPNVIKSWPKQLDLVPECDLKSQAIQQFASYVEGLSEAFREAFREAFPKTLANQQQQQQQQQQEECPARETGLIEPTETKPTASAGINPANNTIDLALNWWCFRTKHIGRRPTAGEITSALDAMIAAGKVTLDEVRAEWTSATMDWSMSFGQWQTSVIKRAERPKGPAARPKKLTPEEAVRASREKQRAEQAARAAKSAGGAS